MPNPSPATGSIQYPPWNPGAAATLGSISLLKVAAAAGDCKGSMVRLIVTACMSGLTLRIRRVRRPGARWDPSKRLPREIGREVWRERGGKVVEEEGAGGGK